MNKKRNTIFKIINNFNAILLFITIKRHKNIKQEKREEKKRERDFQNIKIIF
jgi:hypothetical protein